MPSKRRTVASRKPVARSRLNGV